MSELFWQIESFFTEKLVKSQETFSGSLIRKSHVRRLKEREIEEELRRFDSMDKLIISVLELGDTLLQKGDTDLEWRKMELARTSLRMFWDSHYRWSNNKL